MWRCPLNECNGFLYKRENALLCWQDVDNIYYVHKRKEFNLQDFSHLDSRWIQHPSVALVSTVRSHSSPRLCSPIRDLALAVAALSFNQWFTKIHCKELKLVRTLLSYVLDPSISLNLYLYMFKYMASKVHKRCPLPPPQRGVEQFDGAWDKGVLNCFVFIPQSVDVQQQLTFLLSRSPSLEELSLEDSGLKQWVCVWLFPLLWGCCSFICRLYLFTGNKRFCTIKIAKHNVENRKKEMQPTRSNHSSATIGVGRDGGNDVQRVITH